MSIVIACLASLVVGIVLGIAVEWRLLRPWIRLALRQAAILHGPDLPRGVPGLVRTSFQAGEGDESRRSS